MPNFEEVTVGLVMFAMALVAAKGITSALADEAPATSRTVTSAAAEPAAKPAGMVEHHIRVVLPAPWQPAGPQQDVQH
ncbi:hypothetical protein JQ615_00200 [Bradyrhizobium jicamae]|uniref:Secreted protein n=1 Tax=Bradyrhizobium jicamae TaxID=280332 RepID=A0ABS5FAJ9_9BRAD|nr:hypothetical protein [Bradyrhizobium jicamae]MBR0793806.1 hypothetical protein [Bradyrhizobium jicamae]MBR0933420.1 hypothetical protein [Bradyrhizobium jicamae]